MQHPGGERLRDTALLAWLREARWLTRERMRGYARLFALATACVFVVRFAVRYDTDFLSFWAAGRLSLAGDPAAAYNVAAHWAMERAQIPGSGYFSFFYPPVYLLLCLPLAMLPFYGAMFVFVAGQLLAYVGVMRALLPRAGMALFGFPGVAMAVDAAQNGLLTTSLFGGALLALPRRPVVAGICFGCLCYKPHLGLAIPLALLAARQWRCLTAAAATVAVLVAASVAAFGIATWRGFLAGLPLARLTLQHGLARNINWESAYRAVAQALVAAAACAAVLVACWRRPAVIAGVLPMASLLVTPFLLVYDLALVAIPMAWVVAAAR
ncbi:MAG TPA: glycosyltransferase family 87 protein, partial [Acetobacteraceae bacterium]|nr:glycosyltransferase family 87 protein [Acetobacteraceae bacterium]